MLFSAVGKIILKRYRILLAINTVILSAIQTGNKIGSQWIRFSFVLNNVVEYIISYENTRNINSSRQKRDSTVFLKPIILVVKRLDHIAKKLWSSESIL